MEGQRREKKQGYNVEHLQETREEARGNSVSVLKDDSVCDGKLLRVLEQDNDTINAEFKEDESDTLLFRKCLSIYLSLEVLHFQ